jgi:hypothetical protein
VAHFADVACWWWQMSHPRGGWNVRRADADVV